MPRLPNEPFAAFVGIDWADAQHEVCLQAGGPDQREFTSLVHTPDALDEWAVTLRKRFAGHPVAVCLERNKGPIVYALRQYEFLSLFPVHPLTLAKDREAFTPSHAKDGPTDAELLLTHRDKLTPLHPQSPAMRALAQRVEHRRRLVGDNVRLTNRLTSALKNYCPHVLHRFDDKGTTLFCDFLAQWPPRKAVQLARRATWERFFRNHHVRYANILDQRIQAIKRAPPLTTDAGIIAPNVLLVQALISQLRGTLQAIKGFDDAIAQRAQSHPDSPLFDTLPGAGAVLAPRLRVAFGAQRERYTSADELQKYAGMAPVTERSGNTCRVHWRLQGPTFLRQTFVEWAAESTRHSFWAGAYYQQHRHQGTSHQAAVRALACKWRRSLFRCWQHRTPYDESVCLSALKRRGSPLLQNLASSS
jgi:transposase